MFGGHGSLLVGHTGPVLVFGVIWGVVCLELFPCWFFFPKQFHAALILAEISSFLVSLSL